MSEPKQKKFILIGLVSSLVLVLVGLGLWRAFSAPPVLPPAVKVPPAETPKTYDLGAKQQILSIVSPVPGDRLASPLVITGHARLWYFEGSFPVLLKDANGTVLATGQATAEGDWMSGKFVPFKATLVFAKPATAAGELIFKKDNPSGLPANDDQISVPVQFNLADQAWGPAPPASAPVAACHVGGCSGQLCTDEPDVISDCLYAPEYACYKSATCARQADGQCGWLPTPVLKSCLAKARAKAL